MMAKRALDPQSLVQRHPGLSIGVAGALAEAAAVALSRWHCSPAAAAVTDTDREQIVELSWTTPDTRCLRAWADCSRTTEWGAEAVGVVCVEALRGLVVVERALRGSHTDFYVGSHEEDLEHASLLEVAGTDTGDVRRLFEQKRAQASGNRDRLPLLAVAVRFRDPCALIDDVQRG